MTPASLWCVERGRALADRPFLKPLSPNMREPHAASWTRQTILNDHEDWTHFLMRQDPIRSENVWDELKHINDTFNKEWLNVWFMNELFHTFTSLVHHLHSVQFLDIVRVPEPQVHTNEVLFPSHAQFCPGFGMREQFRHRALC